MVEGLSLDAAWAEAEAALPPGYRMHSVAFWVNRGDWVAQAIGPRGFGESGLGLGLGGTGESPAEALLALAKRGREFQEGG